MSMADHPSTEKSVSAEPRSPESSSQRGGDRAGYWRKNQRLIAILLAIWALVSYGFSILLAEPLGEFSIGRLPAGFWWAQQGSMYVFVGLIFFYAWRMDRLDREYGVDEDREP